LVWNHCLCTELSWLTNDDMCCHRAPFIGSRDANDSPLVNTSLPLWNWHAPKILTPTPLHSGQLQTICDSFNIISFCSNVPTLSRLSHCSSSLVHLVSSSCTTYGSLTEPECREVYANAKMAKTFLVPRYYKRQSHNVLHCSHLLSWSSLSLTHVPNVLNDSDFLFILYCPLVPNV
jgi:hypothetical protein